MKIRNILVALGESTYSQSILDYSVFFAKKFQARLAGIYVKDIRILDGPAFNSVNDFLVHPPYFKVKKERIKASLDERGAKLKEYFLSICKDAGVSCSFQIDTGLISDVILAKSSQFDLVVIGKKGEHASWLERHLGSVCTRVMHGINKPLLVVDHTELREAKRILLCYAGGYFARNTLEFAKYIIAKTKCELLVLTIGTKRTRAFQVQREAKLYFDANKLEVHYLLSIGEVEREVMKIIKMENIDFLITGASLHKNYEDFLSLCLTSKILYDSNIPIFFVR